jgi:hypothetical protein
VLTLLGVLRQVYRTPSIFGAIFYCPHPSDLVVNLEQDQCTKNSGKKVAEQQNSEVGTEIEPG